jgi:hypothetical protein
MTITSVVQADSTVSAMRQKVRRLTASSSESSLTTSDIDKALNTFINQDFPYAIKIDQLRSVYTFFTRPNIDRYPVDVNYNQGFRSPVYFEGIKGTFFKDREQFFNLWPRFPTLFQPIGGDGETVEFNFTIAGPFLSKEVVLGGVDVNGNAISVNDDGNGNLQLLQPNPQISVPLQSTNPAISGMYNQNTQSPGLNNPTNIGTVNYVTGVFAITFPVPPMAGKMMTLWVSQYTTGRPYCLLFWNNEMTIRPVPKLIHKVEAEVYLTPIQFMLSTDVPILTQHWQYISYGAACEILRERQDMEGVANLQEGFLRQEGLVLERQAVEEIGVPTYQLFNSTQTNYVNGGFGQGGGWL